ncbi:hypothetical protein ES708_32589 [subsurface metagenome]
MTVYINGVAIPAPHAASHQDGGSDEVNVAALSGLLGDDQHVLDAEAVAACEAAGLDLASGKSIKVIADLIADNTWAGKTAVLRAGENLTITQLVYVKAVDGRMWKAQSNAAATMPAIAMATGTIAAGAWGEFLLLGFFRDDGTLTFTLGDMLYVSDTDAGAFDNVLPDGGDQVQVVGKCLITTHIIYFNPSLELVETA